jgi:hypothetical protein
MGFYIYIFSLYTNVAGIPVEYYFHIPCKNCLVIAYFAKSRIKLKIFKDNRHNKTYILA